jgi:hypothetical protein
MPMVEMPWPDSEKTNLAEIRLLLQVKTFSSFFYVTKNKMTNDRRFESLKSLSGT